MLLLRDLNEDVQFISEEVAGSKDRNYFVEGPFLCGNVANKNMRMYRMDILRPEVKRYNEEYIKQNRAFGELGHPTGPTINLDRVSHLITSLKEDGNNFIGRAKITTKLPMGAIVKGLLDEGAKLGVSSRGMGSIKSNNEGVNEVQKDFYLATAADIVADPSGPQAFVQGIMEGREWMFLDGKWEQQEQDEARKLIESANRRQLEEIQFKIFENFMSKIAA